MLVGWFPDVMERKVIGEVNLAYLFALSQFFMAWILAFVYVGAAAGWDRQAAALISRFRRRSEPEVQSMVVPGVQPPNLNPSLIRRRSEPVPCAFLSPESSSSSRR